MANNWDDIDSYVSRDLDRNKDGKWLITFADLLSLMLTFFVLLYSMSSTETPKWEEVRDSLQQRLNPDREVEEIAFVKIKSTPAIVKKKGADLDYVHGIIKEKISRRNLEKVKLHRLDDRLIISIASDGLFLTGGADPSDDGVETLYKISDIVSRFNNKIEVNGHTDPSPIANQLYNNNWELSLARSMAVTNYIMAAGYLKPIDSFGMAASRYYLVSDKLAKKDRNSLARRVDIVIREVIAE